MSQPQPEKKSYRSMMQPTAGSDRYHLGEPLITVSPKDLHARTRLPTVFNMAVLSLVSASSSKEPIVENPQGVKFNMKTLSGRLQYLMFEYEAMAPSLDGGARKEYVDVSKLAAIGGSDEQGQIAASVLNEGAKNLTSKEKK